MKPEEKSIGTLYSLERDAEVVADVGSKLLFQRKDGTWAEARQGILSPKQIKDIRVVMEIYQDRMIERFDIRRCSIMIDYMLNSGSPASAAGIIRQHGTLSKKNGCTQVSLKAEDMIEYIRPIIEAILEECMNEIDHPWDSSSARKLFSLVRTNPTLCNRAILIQNIVIKDEYGSQLFRWSD